MLKDAGELVASLGSFFVAVAVFFGTRAQTRWSNDVALRSAEVEDQKFRLELLDRRVQAIEKVRVAASGFWIEGAVGQAEVQAVGEALRVADFVFEDEHRTAIADFLKKLWRWQSLNRQMNAYRERRDQAERYQAVVNEISDFEGELLGGFEPLLNLLKEAARVRAVPPYVAKPTWVDRVFRRIRPR